MEVLKDWLDPEEAAQLRVELAAAKAEIEFERNVAEMNLNNATLLENELAAAKAELDLCKMNIPDLIKAETQLAAHQLVIKQMRAVLVEMNKDCVTDWPALREAVTLQPSTEALDAYVQRAVEQEREWILSIYSPDDSANDYLDKIRGRGK